MSPLVAIPSAYRDDLAPITTTFALDAEQDDLFAEAGIDFEQVTAARCTVTRSDGERLEWTLAIVDGATETAIQLEATVDPADFFDAGGEPVAPGTYDVRILVTDPDGEHVLPVVYLAVQRF